MIRTTCSRNDVSPGQDRREKTGKMRMLMAKTMGMTPPSTARGTTADQSVGRYGVNPAASAATAKASIAAAMAAGVSKRPIKNSSTRLPRGVRVHLPGRGLHGEW
jgi:hypothetical protein